LPMGGTTTLVVALGSAQIGEFSFIVGQAGVRLGMLTQEHYTVLLAAAALSILLNPFLFRALPWLEKRGQRFPGIWQRFDRQMEIAPPATERLHNHMVVVGYGRVGEHIVSMLPHLQIPHLVIELDPQRATSLTRQGVPTLLADAANSEILTHACLPHAR